MKITEWFDLLERDPDAARNVVITIETRATEGEKQ
jgi:hypothetical protein